MNSNFLSLFSSSVDRRQKKTRIWHIYLNFIHKNTFENEKNVSTKKNYLLNFSHKFGFSFIFIAFFVYVEKRDENSNYAIIQEFFFSFLSSKLPLQNELNVKKFPFSYSAYFSKSKKNEQQWRINQRMWRRMCDDFKLSACADLCYVHFTLLILHFMSLTF